MIKNRNQYTVTMAKLRELESDLAALETPDPQLHPRQILARRNSLKELISELRQELSE